MTLDAAAQKQICDLCVIGESAHGRAALQKHMFSAGLLGYGGLHHHG